MLAANELDPGHQFVGFDLIKKLGVANPKGRNKRQVDAGQGLVVREEEWKASQENKMAMY